MPLRAALAPVVLGASAAIILTGCKINSFNASANCDSNGNNCSANFHQSPSHKATHSPSPSSIATVTETATPTQAPTAEPVVTVYPVQVGPCNVRLDGEEMQQLATSETARQDLMDCMQIPDGRQRDQMDNWLAQHALDEINGTPDGRRHWEEHQLTGAYRQYG